MMAEEKKKTTTARKKPKFLRTDWHKKIRLGKGVKKNQKWHGAKGRHNKLRLNRKGRMQRPKVGWGAEKGIRSLVFGVSAVRVENVKDVEAVKKGQGIIIAKVGKKKRADIIKKANEKGIVILNKYRMDGSQSEIAEGSKTKSLDGSDSKSQDGSSRSDGGLAAKRAGATKKAGGKE